MKTQPDSPRRRLMLSYGVTAFVAYAGTIGMSCVTVVHDCSAAGSIWPGFAQTAELVLIFTTPIALLVAAGSLVAHAVAMKVTARGIRARIAYAVPVLTVAALAAMTLVTLAHPAAGCRIDF